MQGKLLSPHVRDDEMKQQTLEEQIDAGRLACVTQWKLCGWLEMSDHLSLFLIPKYSPLIQRVKPSVTTIKVWPAGTDSLLQDKFHHTDWSMFASQATCGSHTDIDTYTSSVLDYINTTVGSVTTWKQITTYPNQKPWMNKEVRLLLKARNIAFRSGDALAYSISRANLRRGIIKAKHCYKLKDHILKPKTEKMCQQVSCCFDVSWILTPNRSGSSEGGLSPSVRTRLRLSVGTIMAADSQVPVRILLDERSVTRRWLDRWIISLLSVPCCRP
ncbi:hypothetical protein F2P81_023422 [Scophthalmus maximus]|uniref:Uncharacterized protein n=1 Tax=Scophthalmus maximus TaxID=52904 RepID=A0A6A4RZ49_SCOMX|nr:hypothetical protein F2P81_023422 [Scophthalmus maximus]